MSDRRQSIYRQNRLAGHLRTISRDRRISGNAIGLYLHLIDMPRDWEISVRALVRLRRFGGRDKVRKTLGELLATGYMTVDQQRHDDGTFARGIYLLADEPRWADVGLEQADIASRATDRSPGLDLEREGHNPAPDNQGAVKEESRVNRTTEQNQEPERRSGGADCLPKVEPGSRPAKGSAVRGVVSGAIAKPAHVRNIEQRRAQLVEAAGAALHEPDRTPALKDCRIIGYWLRTCRYSFSQDVLPTVRARADRCQPGQVRSWRYFDKAIAEWHVKRTGGTEPPGVVKAAETANSDVMRDVFAASGLGGGWR